MPLLKLILKLLGGMLALLLVIVLAYAFLLRPGVMRWGATDAEVHMALPGDVNILPGSEVSTRAITIHAPVSQVWPWVAQLGQERGGFYSHDFFENLFGAQMKNADELLPAQQWLKLGDRVSFFGNGPQGTYGTVTILQTDRVLDLGGWCFFLQPIDQHTTRLIVRYPWQVGDSLMGKIFYYGMYEEAHFVMETGMMLGIKQRAEMGTASK
jgi:hypothetical protein